MMVTSASGAKRDFAMVPPKLALLFFLAMLGFVGDCTPQPQIGYFAFPTLQIADD